MIWSFLLSEGMKVTETFFRDERSNGKSLRNCHHEKDKRSNRVEDDGLMLG
jgi:hypothetical protein